jgi:hypothetical protein
MRRRFAAAMCVLMLANASALASEIRATVLIPAPADSQLSSRVALSGGMGVEYISVPDVVDFVNGAAAAAGASAMQRVPEFKSAVQFFGALLYPLSMDWVLKGEYVYLLVSYNPSIPGRSSVFNLVVHMPSLIMQYVLWDERLYNIKAGGGFGYHFASLTEKYLTVDDILTGKGLGVVADLEANTAFGDHFFGYLGGDLRWEFIGKLKNNASSAQNSPVPLPTVNAFSIGARLGFSYYF